MSVQLHLYCRVIPVLEYSVPPATNGGRSGGQNRFVAKAIQAATGIEHSAKNIGRAKTASKREDSPTHFSLSFVCFPVCLP